MADENDTRLAALDFRRDIERLTEDFTGREWLFAEIDKWLINKEQRFFILTGEPGAGKSAIVARLTQVRQSNIAAVHFCIANNVATITPNTVLRSLAAQLGESLPGYGEALANTIKPHQVSVNVKQEIDKVEAGAKVVGVVVNHLIAADPEEELEILLRAPLSALAWPNNPIFILIDSLDEAMTYESPINLITLLAKTNDLPEWVRFVCTTRPEDAVLSYFKRFAPYIMAAQSDLNLADIDQYIDHRVAKATVQAQLEEANGVSEALTKQVAELANGNFLYTKVLLDDIESGRQTLDDLTALPKSLDEIYHSFLRRFPGADWNQQYQPILGKLAVAQEPITEKQLANFSGIRQRQIRLSLAVVGQYLDIIYDEHDNQSYRLFHQSLRDYLLDEKRSDLFWCDAEEEHEIIANYYVANHQDDWSGCDLCGLNHLPLHLLRAGRAEFLRQLLLRFAWMSNKLRATDLEALTQDFNLVADDYELTLVQEAIRLSAQAISQDKHQLAGQLLGRLMMFKDEGIRQLLSQLEQWRERAWLRPMTASLTPPGGPLMRTIPVSNSGRSLAISADGRLVVSTLRNHLKLWEVDTGQEIWSFTGHEKEIKAVSMTADGRLAASATTTSVKVWDIETGQEIAVWSPDLEEKNHYWFQHKDNPIITDVAFADNGRLLFIALYEGWTVIVWDLEAGGIVNRCWEGGKYERVVVTADGALALTIAGGPETRMNLWNVRNETNQLFAFSSSSPTDAAITPDGRLAIANYRSNVDRTNAVVVWEVESRQEIHKLQGHLREVSAVAITDDGRLAVSADAGGTIRVWDLNIGQTVDTFIGQADYVKRLAVTADGQRVLSLDSYGINVWDLNRNQITETVRNHADAVNSVAMTPDGSLAVTASADRTIKVWDVGTGWEIHTLCGHILGVNAVAITPDGRVAVSGSDDTTVKVWNLVTGREIVTLRGHAGPVKDVAVTADGRLAFSISGRDLKVWHIRTGRETHNLRDNADWSPDFEALRVTTDGHTAFTSALGKVYSWDIVAGKSRRVGSDRNYNFAVTPDGRFAFFSFGADHLSLWDVATNKIILKFPGFTGGYFSDAALTTDARYGLTVAGKLLKLWDLAEQVAVASYYADSALLSCAFAVTGQTVIIAGDAAGHIHWLRLQVPD